MVQSLWMTFQDSWVIFLIHKNEACKAFKTFSKRVQNEKDFCITSIISNHHEEFENHSFENFCSENDISYNFSSPRTFSAKLDS